MASYLVSSIQLIYDLLKIIIDQPSIKYSIKINNKSFLKFKFTKPTLYFGINKLFIFYYTADIIN